MVQPRFTFSFALMKKRIYLIFAIVIAFHLSCGVETKGEDPTGTLVLYQIDYSTLSFEGGVTFTPPKLNPPLLSEIPLEVRKEASSPDLDGAVLIVYTPSQEQLFHGALTNNGNADIFFPEFIEPETFAVLEEPIDFPTGRDIQFIDGDYSQTNFSSIWEAVANLGLTDFVFNETTVVALFLYQPGSNSATSDNWDWILMLYNQ